MVSPLILLMSILRTVVTVALCFLVADLLVGAVHWFEDSYGSPAWPLIGASIIAPNLLHHAKPRAFLANSWWKSADLQVVAGVAVLVGAWLCGVFSAELLLVVALAVNANEFHRWAHRTRAENGRLVTWLQDWKLIQGRAHHGRHHGGQRNTSYCAITAWVDPLLDRIGLWRGLERLIRRITGVLPRIDPAVAARAARP
jgi:ubiquitin-conjugating enzyme E2 variant